MSILRKLASQTAVYGLSTMVGRFLNFLLVPLYTARLQDVADYGEVNVVFSYASFLAVVFTYGMETGFFNFARKHEQPEKVFSTATLALLMSGLGLLLLAHFYADTLAEWAGYPGKPEYATWFAAILAADAVSSLGFAWLRFAEKPWNFAFIRLSNIAVNIGANLFYVLLCPWLLSHGYTWVETIYDPNRTVQYIFFSNLLSSLVVLPLFGKTWLKLKTGFDRPLFRKMLVYSLPMIVVGLAGMINETLDRILLKKLLPAGVGDYEAGIYGAFYKLSLVLTLFVQAFRFAAEPFFFKRAGQGDAQATYAYVMKWFVYVCGFIFLCTMVCLPWLGPLLIRNPAYFADPRGLYVVPILLLANWMLGIYYNLSIWYKVTSKTILGAMTALFGAAITIGGNLLFIHTHSFIASAWSTLAAYTGMVLLGYFWGQRVYPVPYATGKLLAVICGSMLLGYLAHTYNGIVPAASWLTLPAYLLLIWYLEVKQKYVASKNS
ncbi:MAG: oligosaccharide flippase family protein [Bacteroidetes bacterium]|nr:oligosaccharide flippase family protein [Bacteroidota bacterium]